MTLTDEIEIEAEVSRVWDVSTDVVHWPNWLDTIEYVRLEDEIFRLGSVAEIKQFGFPKDHWTVTKFEEGKKFSWSCSHIGFSILASHELQETEDGKCLNRLSLELSGVLKSVVGIFLKKKFQQMINHENRSLKTYCEKAE